MAVGKDRSASPPTERAIAVVELVVERGAPMTAAEVADELGLSRSTVAAVLSALDERGWVRRLADLSYRPGSRLAGLAATARDSLAVPAGVEEVLRALSQRVGCGAALSLVTRTELTFLAVTEGNGRLPAGITTGTSLPLRAPAGAAVVAFADEQWQSAWLATAAAEQRPALAQVLEQIRATGTGLWGIGAADPVVLDVLADVVEQLAGDAVPQHLRGRVLSLLARISGRPYGFADLRADEPLPLSYAVAPVFDGTGRATWELQVGPLREAVGLAEREHCAGELRHAAEKLNMSQKNQPSGH
ncbi:helix-turn-helix domain-containing protein [Saccharopolyspora sp. NPDC050642]|uniref:IclR family transcriptional regulator n=1 Tax=Saccharopolyspora sp. NPDC050642 TaxID=3157099 RepID=UPI0033DBDDFE